MDNAEWGSSGWHLLELHMHQQMVKDLLSKVGGREGWTGQGRLGVDRTGQSGGCIRPGKGSGSMAGAPFKCSI